MKTFIFPIHISPTKPWVPTHMRHLLYTDLIYKATKFFNKETFYCFDRFSLEIGTQTLKLIEYVNQNKIRVKSKTDNQIGELYVKVNELELKKDDSRFVKIREEFENVPHLSDVTKQVYKMWRKYHSQLRLYCPNFEEVNSYKLSLNELFLLLDKHGDLLDQRSFGDGIYFDLTELGIPLRKIWNSNLYDYNYIISILRYVLSQAQSGDFVLFVFDDEQKMDFLMIQKFLAKLGIDSASVLTNRIGVQGAYTSSRKGGWQGFTYADLIKKYSYFTYDEIALGLRMYFFVEHSGQSRKDFDYVSLTSYLNNAKKLLAFLKPFPTLSNTELKNQLSKTISKNKKFITPEQLTKYVLSKKFEPTLRKSIIFKFFL